MSDFYRELFFHGGIPETLFSAMLQNAVLFSRTRVEDLLAMRELHPLYDEYWAGKNADLSKITVPAFVVASWTDHGLHNRGTIEGFKQISSKDKWLLVHGRKKWWHFYQPENVEKQRQFFNRFLKGIDNHVKDWPRVTIEVREKYYVGETRTRERVAARPDPVHQVLPRRCRPGRRSADGAGPPATRRRRPTTWIGSTPMSEDGERVLHVLPRGGRSGWDCRPAGRRRQRMPAADAAAAGPESPAGPAKRATFEIEFSEDTELTGHMSLRLWVSADASDDLDLFVALEKIDASGNLVPFPSSATMTTARWRWVGCGPPTGSSTRTSRRPGSRCSSTHGS